MWFAMLADLAVKSSAVMGAAWLSVLVVALRRAEAG